MQEVGSSQEHTQGGQKEQQTQSNLLLKRARLERGWSQQDVADQVDAPHAFMVNRWENGVVFPGPGYRRKLCSLFGKSLEELGLVKRARMTMEFVDVSNPLEPIFDFAVPLYLAQTQKIVGREHLVEVLLQRFQDQTCSHLALSGLPGIGKTTLATALATHQEIRTYFPGGVLWAELGSRLQLMSNLNRWSGLLGISGAQVAAFKNSDDWTGALRDAIGMRRMLIIIDDAWSIEEALAHVVGGPQCVYLLTTRQPEIAMHFAGKWVFRVPELTMAESRDLLTDQAPVLEESGEDIHSLLQSAGGLPLALKLMGVYLMVQARHHQPRRLQAALVRLQQVTERLKIGQPQAGIERDRRLPLGVPLTLQAMLELSEAILNETERQALYALSVFPPKPHSFSEEAALAITMTPPDVLDCLVDAGLLEVSNEGRYHLHQVISDYAQTRRSDQQAERRLLQYSTQFIEQYKGQNELLDQENALIITALNVARTLSEQEIYLHLLLELVPYLRASKPYDVVEQYLQQAYSSARNGGFVLSLGRIAGYLGEIVRDQGNYKEAEAILREGLRLTTQDDARERIDLISLLGTVLAEQGKYREAATCIEEAITSAERVNDQQKLGAFYSRRGVIGYIEGDWALAEAFLLKAYECEQSNTLPQTMIGIFTNLGLVYEKQGKCKLAEYYLQKALEMSHTHKYSDRIVHIQYRLAVVAEVQGEYIRSKELSEDALAQASERDMHGWVFWLLLSHSTVSVKIGDLVQAEADQQRADALLPAERPPAKVAFLLSVQALIAMEKQRFAQARVLAQQALTIARQIQRKEYCCQNVLLVGMAFLREGHLDLAYTALQEGWELACALLLPKCIGEAKLALGEYYLLRKEYGLAREHFVEVLTSMSDELQEFTARAHVGLAAVALAQQQYQEARSQGEIALGKFENIHHIQQKEMVRWLQALPEDKEASRVWDITLDI